MIKNKDKHIYIYTNKYGFLIGWIKYIHIYKEDC